MSGPPRTWQIWQHGGRILRIIVGERLIRPLTAGDAVRKDMEARFTVSMPLMR
ncbi:hypothetical protein [Streptomyces sp. NPDC048419]|uniref:hypothetical protein n=1 Tax=Streptomyces sp. NPDC048419 TaxID=3365547 RepID=UPI0037214BBF